MPDSGADEAQQRPALSWSITRKGGVIESGQVELPQEVAAAVATHLDLVAHRVSQSTVPAYVTRLCQVMEQIDHSADLPLIAEDIELVLREMVAEVFSVAKHEVSRRLPTDLLLLIPRFRKAS